MHCHELLLMKISFTTMTIKLLPTASLFNNVQSFDKLLVFNAAYWLVKMLLNALLSFYK